MAKSSQHTHSRLAGDALSGAKRPRERHSPKPRRSPTPLASPAPSLYCVPPLRNTAPERGMNPTRMPSFTGACVNQAEEHHVPTSQISGILVTVPHGRKMRRQISTKLQIRAVSGVDRCISAAPRLAQAPTRAQALRKRRLREHPLPEEPSSQGPPRADGCWPACRPRSPTA